MHVCHHNRWNKASSEFETQINNDPVLYQKYCKGSILRHFKWR